MSEAEIIQSYAQLYAQRQDFWDAAYEAARRAGEHRPKGLKEGLAAGLLASELGHGATEHTRRVQDRMGKAVPRYALSGARAYVRGESGNAYTAYLCEVFGPYGKRGPSPRTSRPIS
jgi:hypothetical protein